ncbi:MAG: multicopper oxidase, partial [Terriglobales bacterium]
DGASPVSTLNEESARLGITRREFLAETGIITMALALRQGMGRAMSHTAPPKFRTQLNASSLAQFVDPLPLSEIIQPSGRRPSPDNPAVQLPYYRVAMRQFESKVHRDLKPTRFWGYGSSSPGPTFEIRSGQGLLVEWVNELPATHFLPIDHSIHGAEADKPEVRAVVHLHGAKTPPESDGYPENWYVPGKSAICHYPNHQDATMLWYHDHALGINRLNVFAGLFGAFFVRDEFEDSLNLPRGKYEIPLVLYDRVFDLEAQLNYPISGNEKSPWVPEVFGDAILVNGKLYPYLEVEPRKYRFRVLNGANGRFFHLTLSTENTSNGQTPNAAMFGGQSFHQIGTDQGLLSAPVPLKILSIGPGERADLVVDFSGNAGSNLVLKNDNLNVMQFRVAAKGMRDASALPQTLRPVPKIAESSAVKTRALTLVEQQDPIQRPVQMLLNNVHWDMPVTENPVLDSVEIWNLINTTDDAHPIHLHLVKFQILDRRAFDIATYWMKGELKYRGAAMPPEPAEAGWKDTVRVDPAMVTRIIIRFEGFTGRYVWHCHILEHEDNEMMRPFDVVGR